MTGKIIFTIYTISIFIIGVCSVYYKPEKDEINFNWVFALFLILYIISPIIAKFCGLL